MEFSLGSNLADKKYNLLSIFGIKFYLLAVLLYGVFLSSILLMLFVVQKVTFVRVIQKKIISLPIDVVFSKDGSN